VIKDHLPHLSFKKVLISGLIQAREKMDETILTNY